MKLATASYSKASLSYPDLLFTWSFSALIIVMASLQLITYEKFVPMIENYQVIGGSGGGKLIAALIVISEVLALPFLLRMRLSYLFRLLSCLSLGFSGLLWLFLGLWSYMNHSPSLGSGIFGSILARHFPDWNAIVIGILILGAGFVTWRILKHDMKRL